MASLALSRLPLYGCGSDSAISNRLVSRHVNAIIKQNRRELNFCSPDDGLSMSRERKKCRP